MNFVVCGDCHFTSQQPVSRLDNILDASIRKWSAILHFAARKEAAVLIAGDFCDKPRDWYVLPRLMAVLANYKKVLVYAVYGQHDMYMRSEGGRDATILGVLARAGMVKIVDNKGVWFGARKPERPWCVHGCHWGEDIPAVARGDNLNQRYAPRHALIVHAPIAQEATYPGQHYLDADDVMEKYPDYELIVCGDVHRRFVATGRNKQLVVNTGPIMRLEATEYNMGLKPAVMLYCPDACKYEWYYLPSSPSVDILSRDHIEKKEERKALLDSFISSIDASTTLCRAGMDDRLAQWITQNEQTHPKVANLLTEVCFPQRDAHD